MPEDPPSPANEPALAPLPDHNRLTDPAWIRQWERFSHLTTPLRRRGLVCDIEDGAEWTVHAQLPDASHLLISGPTSLPHPDEAHPPGWLVTHQSPEDGVLYGVPYDSCPGQPHEKFGPDLEPMLDRIDRYCQEIGIALPFVPESNVAAPPAALSLSGHLPTAVLETSEAETVFATACQAAFRRTQGWLMASVPVGDHHYDVVVAGPYPPRVLARRGPTGTDWINCRASLAEAAALRVRLQRRPPAPTRGEARQTSVRPPQRPPGRSH
ncbi:hypothetical protein ABZ820_04905 [Streptomyces diacarni]|uniref:hypothetical protein n=1 Tax=Streptomyces diacarni TaxID=2800381 RepID=UPI0033FBCF7B